MSVSNDHPLLVTRKRMLSGETKHNPPGHRSGSELVQDENTFHVRRRIAMSHPRSPERFASPTLQVLTPLLSPPPTPGRDHNVMWDADFPSFLPARREPGHIPAILRTPEQRDQEASERSSYSTPVPSNLQLRPRFDCEWLKDLGLESPDKGVPSIPYAPFVEKKNGGGSEEAPHEVAPHAASKKSTLLRRLTGKLADTSLGENASVAAAKAKPKNFGRRMSGVGARCA